MLAPSELLLILVLVVFFYGGRKLPQLGENLGKSITEFKKAIRSDPAQEREDAKQEQLSDERKRN